MPVMPGCGKFYGETPWNDETVKILRDMWESGRTALDISFELKSHGYSVTRNAVIGKAHRMNIKQPPRENSPKEKQNQPRKRIVVPATHPRAPEWKTKKKETKLQTKVNTGLDPANAGIAITELTSENCHAIVRDGNRYKLATYCGEKAEPNKSFCSAHAAIYYRPPDHRIRLGRWR
jgi:hypothetical protein